MDDLERIAKEHRERIFHDMVSKKGNKYRFFLRALRSFRYFSQSNIRGELLESYYALMRYVDDIVDGDSLLPESCKSREEYVEQRIQFASNPNSPADLADYLMLHSFLLTEQLGFNIFQETQDILGSLLFDARRVGKNLIFPATELWHHFYLLDIRGTVRATLKLFREDPDTHTLLEPLGNASRIYYNLRDYEEDIKAGYINISQEDCERYEINPVDLDSVSSNGVQEWFREQADEGLRLITRHKQIMRENGFGFLGRMTLPIVYERPARRYFERLLENKS